eukprot:1196392-Prorocentrum_minimum.AAC.3
MKAETLKCSAEHEQSIIPAFIADIRGPVHKRASESTLLVTRRTIANLPCFGHAHGYGLSGPLLDPRQGVHHLQNKTSKKFESVKQALSEQFRNVSISATRRFTHTCGGCARVDNVFEGKSNEVPIPRGEWRRRTSITQSIVFFTIERAVSSTVETNANDMNASMEAVIKVLGEKDAEMAANQFPDLLRTEVSVISDVFSTLVQVIGADRAVQAAGANLQLLQVTSGERMLDSMPTLVEMLGVEDAVATVVRNPSVLRLSSASMHSAFDVLESVLGHADAVAAVGRNPMVLTARAETMTEAMKALVEVLGQEQAVTAVKRSPGRHDPPFRRETVCCCA